MEKKLKEKKLLKLHETSRERSDFIILLRCVIIGVDDHGGSSYLRKLHKGA